MIKVVFLHGVAGSKSNFVYLEKEFPNYETLSFDLIGFGKAEKPKIDYSVDDFLKFLNLKLNLDKNDNVQYILVGHSLGALLAKELTKKYPKKIKKSFLIAYPFLGKNKLFKSQIFFNRQYANGSWWTKIMCKSKIIYKYFLYPFIFLFKYKYRQSYINYFKHTYQSAFGTIQNTILKDGKEDLFSISRKIIFINGGRDQGVDLKFSKQFKYYILNEMRHAFFNHEKRIAQIIKLNI